MSVGNESSVGEVDESVYEKGKVMFDDSKEHRTIALDDSFEYIKVDPKMVQAELKCMVSHIGLRCVEINLL